MVVNNADSETPSQLAFDHYRTVALSDGVFAIALTLLAFTISFPDLHGAARSRLASELGNRIPELLSYALSFTVLGFLWLRHHAFFRDVKRVDGGLAALNLVYLAVVAFLPYPTRLLGQYGDHAVSAVLYAITILLITLMAALIRFHAARNNLAPPGSLMAWQWNIAAPVVFLLSIPLALLVSAKAAEWSWIALAVIAVAARRRKH